MHRIERERADLQGPIFADRSAPLYSICNFSGCRPIGIAIGHMFSDFPLDHTAETSRISEKKNITLSSFRPGSFATLISQARPGPACRLGGPCRSLVCTCSPSRCVQHDAYRLPFRYNARKSFVCSGNRRLLVMRRRRRGFRQRLISN
jgi:hypothetical protein